MQQCITHIVKGAILLTAILSPIFSWGQDKSTIRFIENKGQFNDQTDFQLKTNAGDIYLEGTSITFNLFEKGVISDIHLGKSDNETVIKGHAYRVKFKNANEPNIERIDKSTNYNNYFIGNKPENWVKNVYDYSKIIYQHLYSGIDLAYYGFYDQLKYDFIVAPFADPSQITLLYDGVDSLQIKNGHSIIYTSIGKVIEQSPYVYQIINGDEKKVNCHYTLTGNEIKFSFPEGYDNTRELIIDPVLTFGTYTGSSATNFGCTATYDSEGNMYVGGTVFSIGYPFTLGAYQTSMAGGTIDMGITKFNTDGTQLIYSTYIGGSDSEIPHSLVVNSNDELCVLGTTGSSNFPVINGFDNTFSGGPSLNFGAGYGFNYLNGCDIVVVKLSADGSNLLSGTYIGGTDNDGINKGSLLHYNYGDAFRGEIIVDAADNIYVASTTGSVDFPVTGNAVQPSSSGGTLDACVFKFDTGLSNLLYSTYLGGDSFDCAYSIQIGNNGDMCVSGGTMSANFPTSSSALNPSYLGGTSDGFVTRISANGNSIIGSTFMGTGDYDQCYFVQTDLNDDIFVVGQSEGGGYPTTPGVYANPNSGQFIHKLTNDLSTTLLSTTFGSSSGHVDMAISAFLVSDCGSIYISGWGGTLNGNASVDAHATFSSTSGLPLSPGGSPFQSTTDGSDFYLLVLDEDASGLNYATYFGGGVSEEHVDGGTSRFDKNGKVYQAVCAGCGGNSDFPTTPGAWSNVNPAPNCNLGAFKFDLGNIIPSISIPQPWVCLPSSYQFDNLSSGGNGYEWDFGDGNFSNDFAPAHTYNNVGQYDVSLIVSDSLGCLTSDTSIITIEVLALDNALIQQIDTICPGDSVLLEASGGTSYSWTPTTYLSNPTIANPMAFPPVTTSYQVIATDNCGIDTATATVFVHIPSTSTIPDATICGGTITTLEAFGGVNYSWYPTTAMINPSSQTPNVAPLSSITYYVDITTASGCIFTDSVVITAVSSVPLPNVSSDTTVCQGDLFEIYAYGASTVLWSPSNVITNPTDSITTAQLSSDAIIYVNLTNICGTVIDSIQVSVISINPSIVSDTSICPGGYANLWAAGGDFYNWYPAGTLSNPSESTTTATPVSNTTYFVDITNLAGCIKTLDVTVNIHPIPLVDAGEDIFLEFGYVTSLNGTTYGNYFWDSEDSLSCIYCLNPEISPVETSSYILYTMDQNGCENSDTVMVFLDGVLYVPNTFTPNSDGINDHFVIKGEEIKSFQLYIFNRWGQLIYTADKLDDYWDGRHKGVSVQNDTYVWKVTYEDYQNNSGSLIGHVNVLR